MALIDLALGAANAAALAKKAKRKLDDKERGMLANTQSREQEAALAAMAGGEVEDEPAPADAMGNVSTEIGEGDDAYRLTSGNEEVEDGDLSALFDKRIAEALAKEAGGGVEDTPDSKPMGNMSTEVPAGEGNLNDRVTEGGEGYSDIPEYSLADFVDTEGEAAMVDTAEGTDSGRPKNPLIDPTIGARPAGIPEETLATLFKKTHGGSFDPNSKMDRAKMQVIKDMIQEDKSLLALSPAKFALKVYARK